MTFIFDKPTAGGHFRQDLARWRQLVTPPWLAQLYAGRPVEAAPPGDWRLIEVGCAALARFERAHIPGATYLDTNQLETAPLFNKISDPDLLALLLRLGVRHDTTVILYGRGSLTPARAAQLLLYAGVHDVRLLDGGLDAWCAAGLTSEAGRAHAQATSTFGIAFPACPHLCIDSDGARRLLSAPDATLVSIRTWSEHAGLTSGYSYIAERGEIPGARWGRAGREGDVQSMSDYQLPNATMRPAVEIAALRRAAGILPGRRTAFYCGTGWRASLAFFYAWLMGWDDIALYDGGWYEWSQDPANPVQLRAGEPQVA